MDTEPTESWGRQQVTAVLTAEPQLVPLQTEQGDQRQEEADSGDDTGRIEGNPNFAGKNDFKRSRLRSRNLSKKERNPHSYVCFPEQLKAGQFLFYSIVFYTKIKSSFILQVFWTPVILIFFSFNKKSDKTSKHTRSTELETSQHLIHPGNEDFGEKHVYWGGNN